MDLSRLARFPFLPEAADYAAKEGPALEELLTDRVYSSAREKGRERLRLALEDASLPAPPLSHASAPRELLEDILAYVYARILVCALDDAYVARRHALAEAVRVREYLLRDPANIPAAAAALELAFQPFADEFVAHFTDFLRYSVHLKDAEWKLVSQRLSKGDVPMSAHVASRLVQEALRRRIESELPKEVSDEVATAVEPDAAPLRESARIRKEAYSVEGFGAVDLTCIPPCMRNILGSLQRGENAAHNARFAIVTFLHKIGMSSEEIMKLFSQAPDFREDLTRYQVEHITGVTSGTTYSVPGCENLKTFNLCYADSLCSTKTKAGKARVLFPQDYYRLVHEAQEEVNKIVPHIPIENPTVLAFAAAGSYPLLLRLREIAANPNLARLDGETLIGLALAHKEPIAVVGEIGDRRLVVEPGQPWEIVDLLAADWVELALTKAAPPPPDLPR